MARDPKSRIRLPDGFRFLREEDSAQPFQTGDSRMDRYMLRNYLQWSALPNDLVMLYETRGRIAGVVEISVYDDYIAVEMLGKNILVDATRVGTKLMSLVENIGKQIGINEIRLEALDRVVGWYDDVLGYEEYSDAYYDADFGRLTPKKKSIP